VSRLSPPSLSPCRRILLILFPFVVHCKIDDWDNHHLLFPSFLVMMMMMVKVEHDIINFVLGERSLVGWGSGGGCGDGSGPCK
jgi:hypothetical protein